MLVFLLHQPPKCWQNNICGVDGGGIENDGGLQFLRKLCMLVHDTHLLIKQCVSTAQYLPEENFEQISN